MNKILKKLFKSEAKILAGKRGMTLVEALVSVAVFIFVSLAVYEAYAGMLSLVTLTRVKITGANLVNEQFEIVKNLNYDSVGTVAGIPSGVVPQVQVLNRDGHNFTVTTTIRNIDDPFDGTVASTPSDTSPADYKLVEISVSCDDCKNFTPVIFTGRVAPKALEAASTNGSIFIHVIDANGVPVQGANVHVVNSAVSPAINLNDVTDDAGLLQLIGVPPSVQNYQITVTKTGYSSDRTYTVGDSGNPNPAKPHLTVVAQQLTEASFAIDRVSTINVATERSNCSPVAGVSFDMSGAKLIGINPDVKKYSASLVTNGSGFSVADGLEWDTYDITMTDSSYYLAGTISPLPIALSPNESKEATFVITDNDPNALLVSVKDSASGLPVSGAKVTITDGSGTAEYKTTGRGYIQQTDWSGGGGVDLGSPNTNQFFSTDGNIEYSALPGQLKLVSSAGIFDSSGILESSTFDTGAASTFFEITWKSENQPVASGADSVKFQIATSNVSTGPWSFLGPDGTAGTYYTLSNHAISSGSSGNRYLRYKAYLSTADLSVTPVISDIAFTFTSDCAPPGQVIFTGENTGTYTLKVEKTGYQTYEQPQNINSGWQSVEIPFLTE